MSDPFAQRNYHPLVCALCPTSCKEAQHHSLASLQVECSPCSDAPPCRDEPGHYQPPTPGIALSTIRSAADAALAPYGMALPPFRINVNVLCFSPKRVGSCDCISVGSTVEPRGQNRGVPAALFSSAPRIGGGALLITVERERTWAVDCRLKSGRGGRPLEIVIMVTQTFST